ARAFAPLFRLPATTARCNALPHFRPFPSDQNKPLAGNTPSPLKAWGQPLPSAGDGRGVGARGRGLPVLQGQQLLPVDGDVPGRLDAQADLAPVDVDDRDADVLADVDLFSELAAEDQHV